VNGSKTISSHLRSSPHQVRSRVIVAWMAHIGCKQSYRPPI
jgi:hypothetical protein